MPSEMRCVSGLKRMTCTLTLWPILSASDGMVDAPPGDVGDVQQAVDAAEIDEGAVIGDVLDDAVEDLALLEAGDQFGALLGAALLEHGAARHDDVAARAVHLEDLERLRRAQQRADVAHRADIDLAARQERDGAAEIDREAALDPAEDRAGDPLVRLEILFELGPGLLAPRLLARQRGLAVLVLHPLEEDLDDVADIDLGRAAAGREFLERHAAFGFEADIDQRGVVLDRDDPALDDGAFETAGGDARATRRAARRNFPSMAISAVSVTAIPSPRSRLCKCGPAGIEAERAAGMESGAAALTRSCRQRRANRRGVSRTSRRPMGGERARDNVGGLLEHLIGVEPGRIDGHGVGSRRERRDPTPAVARVAFLHVLQDIAVYSRRAALPQLLDPPLGARLRAGGDEQLDRRRRDRRPCRCRGRRAPRPLRRRRADAPRTRAGTPAARPAPPGSRRPPRTARGDRPRRASADRPGDAGVDPPPPLSRPRRPDRRRLRPAARSRDRACRCRDARAERSASRRASVPLPEAAGAVDRDDERAPAARCADSARRACPCLRRRSGRIWID